MLISRIISVFNTFILLFLFSSVQSISRVQFFATPSTTACQASMYITNSQSLLKLMFFKSVMPMSRWLTVVGPEFKFKVLRTTHLTHFSPSRSCLSFTLTFHWLRNPFCIMPITPCPSTIDFRGTSLAPGEMQPNSHKPRIS